MTTVPYRDLLGVKFVPKGRDPKIGLDCHGLVMLVLGRLGITVPDPFTQGEHVRPCDSHEWLRANFGGWARIEKPHPGCVVALTNNGVDTNHIGVMISEMEFVHSERTVGVVVGRINSAPFDARFRGFYEYHA